MTYARFAAHTASVAQSFARRRSYCLFNMKDRIIAELHRLRRRHAAKFNYDVDAIVREAAQRDRAEKRRVYSLRRGKLLEVKP